MEFNSRLNSNSSNKQRGCNYSSRHLQFPLEGLPEGAEGVVDYADNEDEEERRRTHGLLTPVAEEAAEVGEEQLEGGEPAPDEDENLGANNEAGGGDQQLQVPPTAQAPPGVEPAILDLFDASNGVMDQLLAIVEQYWKSEISKIDASLAISEAIPVADRTSDEFKGAFRTFMAQIEEVDHLRDQAAGRVIVGDTIAAGPQPAQGSRTTKAQDEIVNTIAATDPELAGDPDMLWNTPAEIPINRKVSESLALSIRILRVTRKDPKFFLNMVLGKESLPPLPRDEWFKIVKGEAVNYDDVFKQLDTDFITEQRQFDLGNNLTLKVQDEHNLAEQNSKGKGIATVGEWTRVHDLVLQATVMLFKHRKDELRSYGESIQRLSETVTLERTHSISTTPQLISPPGSHTSAPAELVTLRSPGVEQEDRRQEEETLTLTSRTRFATTGTRINAGGQKPLVDVATSATSLDVESLTRPLTTWQGLEMDGLAPRYMRGLVWNVDDDNLQNPVYLYSLQHPPLPHVPLKILENCDIITTITQNPQLFRVVTPLNQREFTTLLHRHPNQPFVTLFLKMLREGAWLWAETPDEYPLTWDNSHRTLKEESQMKLVDEWVANKLLAGRYSPPFTELLPGMYSCPIGVVPKPHTDPQKYRVVFDYSAGSHSCNSMVPKDDRRVPLDTIYHLGRKIRCLRKSMGPGVPPVVYKSDVAMAYRIVPMHPCWQIKQVVTWRGVRYVDWCNIWGFCAAGHLLGLVMSLMLWIAWEIYHIDPSIFVDDCFGVEIESNTMLYKPYNIVMPREQCLLLTLWDRLNIPHDRAKQLWGRRLGITGYAVDTDAMTVTMSEAQQLELIEHIRWFLLGRKHTLQQFQQITGWINWALNNAPVLRPTLSCMYEKMRGKTHPQQQIYLNNKIRQDLQFFSREFANVPGVLLIDSIAWSLVEADLILYGNACLTGLGFFSPATNEGFLVDVPALPQNIFLFESFTVLCQLQWAASLKNRPPTSRGLL